MSKVEVVKSHRSYNMIGSSGEIFIVDHGHPALTLQNVKKFES
jgi:hypothetical protein